MQYPITCVLGRRGSGKTLFMTALAEQYRREGNKIFANYKLIGIEFTAITWKMIATLPKWLENGIVFLDEIQMGADSYEIFKKGNKAITTLATQLRKRKITLFYATQVFTMATKRLRQQTNYIIEVTATETPGIANVKSYDQMEMVTGEFLNEWYFDGRPYFNMYDTNEIIEPMEDDEDEDENT